MSAFIKALLSLALLLNPSFTLEVNFYRHSCPQAEYAVKGIVKQHFQRDPSVPAGLLRLHFHEYCIIRVRSFHLYFLTVRTKKLYEKLGL